MSNHEKLSFLIKQAVRKNLADLQVALTEEQLQDVVALDIPGGEVDITDLRLAVTTLQQQDHVARTYDEDRDIYKYRITTKGKDYSDIHD